MGPAPNKPFGLWAMPWSPAWAINSLTGLFNFIFHYHYCGPLGIKGSKPNGSNQTRMTHNEHPLKCIAVLYRLPRFHELSKELAKSWEIVRCLF